MDVNISCGDGGNGNGWCTGVGTSGSKCGRRKTTDDGLKRTRRRIWRIKLKKEEIDKNNEKWKKEKKERTIILRKRRNVGTWGIRTEINEKLKE